MYPRKCKSDIAKSTIVSGFLLIFRFGHGMSISSDARETFKSTGWKKYANQTLFLLLTNKKLLNK